MHFSVYLTQIWGLFWAIRVTVIIISISAEISLLIIALMTVLFTVINKSFSRLLISIFIKIFELIFFYYLLSVSGSIFFLSSIVIFTDQWIKSVILDVVSNRSMINSTLLLFLYVTVSDNSNKCSCFFYIPLITYLPYNANNNILPQLSWGNKGLCHSLLFNSPLDFFLMHFSAVLVFYRNYLG